MAHICKAHFTFPMHERVSGQKRTGGSAMLLRRYSNKIPPQKVLAMGQVTMLVGLGCIAVGQIVLRFAPEMTGFSWMDFLGGFLHGLGGTCMGVSIVLNVTGFRRMREEAK